MIRLDNMYSSSSNEIISTPRPMLQTSDARLPMETRTAAAQKIAECHLCCVDEGATDTVLVAMAIENNEAIGSIDWHHFFAEDWQCTFVATAEEIDTCVCDIEDRHARSKAQAEHSDSIELFCAKYCLAEAKTMRASYVPPQQPDLCADARVSGKFPRWNGKKMFHCHRTAITGGSSATGPAWAATHQEWLRMGSGEHDAWEFQAELKNAEALPAVPAHHSSAGAAEAPGAEHALVPFDMQVSELAGGLKKHWNTDYPLAESFAARQPFKDRAKEFEHRVSAAVPPQPKQAAIKPKQSCQDKGACRRKWQKLDWPYQHFTNFTQRTKAFVLSLKDDNAQLIKNSGLILQLLEFSWWLDDLVHCVRYAWVAFHMDNPSFQVFMEVQQCVPTLDAYTNFPFIVLPITEPFVQSSLEASKERFPSNTGVLRMRLSYDWADYCLTSPGMHVTRGGLWRLRSMRYTPCCCGDFTAAIAELSVTGPNEGSVDLTPPLKRTQKAKAYSGVGAAWDLLKAFEGIGRGQPSSSSGAAGSKSRGGRGGRGHGRGLAHALVHRAETDDEEADHEESDGDIDVGDGGDCGGDGDEEVDPAAKVSLIKLLKITEAQEDPEFHNPADVDMPDPTASSSTAGAGPSDLVPEFRPSMQDMPFVDPHLFVVNLAHA
jgi:hypothetical protein